MKIKSTFIIQRLLLMCTLCFYFLVSDAQDQRKADSLLQIYNTRDIKKADKLEILKLIGTFSSDPSEAIKYTRILLKEATEQNSPFYECYAYLIQGSAYTRSGQIEKALDVLFKGAEIASKNQFNEELGNFYGNISNAYSTNGDIKNSLIYQKKALKLFETEGQNPVYLGFATINIGYDYYTLAEYDSAEVYYQNAMAIFEELDHEYGIAYTTGNQALVRWKKGHFDEAEAGLLKAIAMLKPREDHYAVADYLHNLGAVYYEMGEYNKAIDASLESVETAMKVNMREPIRDASLMLSKLYESRNQYQKAYQAHKQYVTYRDSIQNIETTQRMADMRTQFEVGQKQAEVDLLTAEKRTQQILLWAVAIGAFLVLVVLGLVYKNYKDKNRINKILEDQKAELERINQTKDKFFSIISHDLRGPVSSFHGISRMIKFLVEAKETDQLIEVADEIDHSVDRLSELLDNLLNWAVQQQGNITNVPEKLEMNELVSDLLGTMSTMAKGKQIELKQEVDENLMVWADKNATMTILRNLINNALKFTPAGGKVSVSAYAHGDVAEIKVSDTGVGITKEKLDSLFKLQDKKSTYGTSGEKGLGLGLQLVKEFVEMVQGEITVESKEGEGTTFIIKVPLFETQPQSVRS